MDTAEVATWVRLGALAVLALMASVVFGVIVYASCRQLRDSDPGRRRAAEAVARQHAALLRFLLVLMVMLVGGPSVAVAIGRLAGLLMASG